MATFKEANQARVSLKMTLSEHAWYKNSVVVSHNDDYSIIVNVKHLDNQVRKICPQLVLGVEIKIESD